jgi:peptidase A4-like protein
MLAKYFVLLGAIALAVSPLSAQQSSIAAKGPEASSAAEAFKAFRSAPMRRATGRALADGTADSYNWGGYAVTGTDFTSAKGTWTVPTVDCAKSPNAWVSFWVGIDGYSSTTVEQAGTLTWCNRSTAEYYTWYEFYPAATTYISTVPSKPGDKMFAQITYNGSEFKVEIKDDTTGKSFTKSQAVSGAARTSAEWIVEAPETVTGITNLADFTKASFTGGTATDSAIAAGPISAFGSDVEKITQIDDTEYTESTTSGLSTSGEGFTTTWVEYN